MRNKRMLPDWLSAALQTSRKCGRYMSNHFDLNLELAQREAEGLPVVGPWDPNLD